MPSKHYNPERHWRNKSYRKGGEIPRNLKHKDTKRLDSEEIVSISISVDASEAR